MMLPMSPIRSAAKLTSIVIRNLGSALRSAARRDVLTAGEHLRTAAIFLHDDLVQLIVAVQRKLLGPNRLQKRVDRILIVKLDRIGDMVNVGPVLDALRRGFPRARLDMVGHPVPLSLLDGDDRVDGTLAYRSSLYHPLPLLPPGPRSWWLLLKLLGRRYPLVVYLRGSFLFLPLALTSRLAATKFLPHEHVVDRNMKAVEEFLGAIPQRQSRLHVQPEAARAVLRDALLPKESNDGPRIAIHAASVSAGRVWPTERFSELADRLAADLQARVHFVGGASDEPLLEMISRRCRVTHGYHSSLSLPQTVAMVAQCDLLIGNDSGLSHIAAAVGTRLVVIWGAASLSMSRPNARPDRLAVLWHDLPCRSTCPEIRCDHSIQYDCLKRTSVDDVVAAARRLLESELVGPPEDIADSAGIGILSTPG